MTDPPGPGAVLPVQAPTPWRALSSIFLQKTSDEMQGNHVIGRIV
ncbi:MAG TPA: hypothetical protein PLM74_06280 [Bacillota bacterium]|nr:hypothetical protein [Bacillota bacterium]